MAALQATAWQLGVSPDRWRRICEGGSSLLHGSDSDTDDGDGDGGHGDSRGNAKDHTPRSGKAKGRGEAKGRNE